MIVFDLRCTREHVFEAWFGSTEEFEGQKQAGYVECPLCGCRDIGKAVMAPAVSPKGNRIVTDSERKTELKRLAAMQAEVEASCDYVGRGFVSEARARHRRGETGQAPIFGGQDEVAADQIHPHGRRRLRRRAAGPDERPQRRQHEYLNEPPQGLRSPP